MAQEEGQEEGQVQGERSDGWDTGRSNGWPLGLQRLNARLSIASSSTFLISTPSLTSFSSSDFDTESSGSFFPEKSTTLGSLIGIQSSSQVEITSMEEKQTTRKSTNGNSRNRAWWSVLGCGGGLQDDASNISPSLARFLEKGRRQTLSQRQSNNCIGEHHTHEEQEHGQEQDERFHSDTIVSHRDGPYDNESATASRPSGPTLRFVLQQPSPTSYPSTDWNVYSDLSHHHHTRGDPSPGHGRCHTLWPGLCGRLSTCAAN